MGGSTRELALIEQRSAQSWPFSLVIAHRLDLSQQLVQRFHCFDLAYLVRLVLVLLTSVRNTELITTLSFSRSRRNQPRVSRPRELNRSILFFFNWPWVGFDFYLDSPRADQGKSWQSPQISRKIRRRKQMMTRSIDRYRFPLRGLTYLHLGLGRWPRWRGGSTDLDS